MAQKKEKYKSTKSLFFQKYILIRQIKSTYSREGADLGTAAKSKDH